MGGALYILAETWRYSTLPTNIAEADMASQHFGRWAQELQVPADLPALPALPHRGPQSAEPA